MTNPYLTKIATLISQYECPKTKKKVWVPLGKPIPPNYVKTNVMFYQKKKPRSVR